MLLRLKAKPSDKYGESQENVHIHQYRGNNTPLDRFQGFRRMGRFQYDHIQKKDFDDNGTECQNKTAVRFAETLG